MKRQWCLWWLGMMLMVSGVHANDQQRYLAYLQLNLSRAADAELDMMEEAVKAGCNAVHLTIHWDYVYPSATSQPDWKKYDSQIALAQKLGVKVALRIYLGRNEGRIAGFMSNDERQRDQQGRALVSGYASTYFSFASQPAVDKGNSFIKEVCERYKTAQEQGIISWVSVCLTPTQETGYFFENSPEGYAQPTVFDYSPAMKREFRIWLSRKYTKIARLNVFWQTDYKDFQEVEPQTALANRDQVFWGQAGKDWYVFRHAIFKQFIEQTTRAIKNVHSGYRVITDFGSVFDQLSAVCGSVAFRDLNAGTDGVKINNDVRYDHRFSMDILRSNVLPNQWILNEVFPDFRAQKASELITQQFDESYAHGARWISVVLGTKEVLEQAKPILKSTATKWLSAPFVDVLPKAYMTYNLSRVLEFGYFSGGVYGEWANRAGPESNRSPVNIRMIEDILADSLQGAINRPPYVKNPLPTKTIKVNSPFSYRLSSEVFVDVDGAISSVALQGQPSWLRFSNGIFSGTPTQTGIYTFTVRATDDDGAIVETTFTIIVDNLGRFNQAPTLRKRISNAEGLYKQPFILSISDSTFVDLDGFISRMEVIGLPAWAQYRKGEIRGLADTVGVYSLRVRGYDDEDAVVETSFTITINYPTVYFDLIQAGKPGQRFLIKRLQPKEQLLQHQLPTAVNVYANCDAVFDAFDLEITGAQYQKTSTTSSPFSLYEGDAGLPVTAGKYFLRGKAYFRKQLIASTEYELDFLPSDPVSKQPISVEDWSVFPNPATDFVHLKHPSGKLSSPRFVTLLGQEITVPEETMYRSGTQISFNLRQLRLGAGIYFLKLQLEDATWKVFRVVKY
ncbi:putative Ig domain-containing protein [Runella sp. SP2]|uniref:putative Ig domain-containing protein n=1 Tax=Runella sp. SP2 TaxID=2268026 RepID=UPI000F0982AA|nr:putative Ig domain-containing protein [Runella sp. SP2]AYQ31661.1 hypothetical protein DTQ70_05470 [Runella sp. SP2]